MVEDITDPDRMKAPTAIFIFILVIKSLSFTLAVALGWG